MADDSFLTDSEDERAVEDVLSQAMDHSLLEQIAAINCSSFNNARDLPYDLENRFRKLKALPTNTTNTTATTAGVATSGDGHRLPPAKSKSFTPRSGVDSNANESNSVDFEDILDLKRCSEKSSPLTDDLDQHSDGNRDDLKGTNPKSRSRSKLKSSSNSKDVCKPKGSKSKSKSKSESRSRTGSSESRSDTWSLSSPESESESRSVSPARRGIGCLWCSSKKEKRKQGKENRLSSSSWWGNDYDVEFLKTFSMKEQKKIMRKAMKEEEKINREAEKIVKWAKQASARMMDVSGVVDDQLSDLEDTTRRR